MFKASCLKYLLGMPQMKFSAYILLQKCNKKEDEMWFLVWGEGLRFDQVEFKTYKQELAIKY